MNRNALQIVTNRPVTVQMDFVSAVSLVTGKKHAIHYVQFIVSKEFVTKAMVAVHRDVHRDIMETCVIEHAVSGVQEGHATNKLQHVLMDVCRTGQGLNVTDVTQIIMDLPVLWNATITVKIVLVMTLLVSVLWDVKRGSMETNVTDNVRVVRQVVID